MDISMRMFTYMVILSFYYTFTGLYNYLIGDTQVILSLVVITLFSYGWLIYYKFGNELNIRYIDLVLRVFTYSFVSFFIASSVLMTGEATVVRAIFLISPITLWSIMWIDHCLRKYRKKDPIPDFKKHLWK